MNGVRAVVNALANKCPYLQFLPKYCIFVMLRRHFNLLLQMQLFPLAFLVNPAGESDFPLNTHETFCQDFPHDSIMLGNHTQNWPGGNSCSKNCISVCQNINGRIYNRKIPELGY
jgi:hypothetical protein